MDREIVFRFCRENYGTEPDYPFKDDRVSAVLRHSDTRKWYALVMEVSPGVFFLAGREKDRDSKFKNRPGYERFVYKRQGHFSGISYVKEQLDIGIA